MKLAAMEALYNGGENVGLTAFAAINPFTQPNYAAGEEHTLHISIPNGLSILATHSTDGYVPGINDIINGYTKADGTQVAPLKERIANGKIAIQALAQYRKLKAQPDANINALNDAKAKIEAHMADFGYGYLNSEADIVPYIPLCFYAFRVMVGVGTLLLLFFLLAGHIAFRCDISNKRWLHWAAIAMLPLAYIASEAGWIVAEMGRQPWAIQDMLPLNAAVSDIGAGSVATTFFIFLALFTTLLIVEISILCKQIKKGPEWEKE